MERLGLPFAPVRRPGELADDPHLNASGGLIDVELPTGRRAKTPVLPLTMGGKRIRPLVDPPRVGAHTNGVLESLDLSPAEIEDLVAGGVVGVDSHSRPGATNGERKKVAKPLNTWA